MPAVFRAVDVVSTPALTIQEYFGNVASHNSNISACLVKVTAACEEPYQVADFDEYLLVTSGLLVVTHGGGTTTVKQGEGLFLRKGMRLKISWPGPCQYVPICLPAFSPAICHREAEEGLMKDAAALERLDELHAQAKSRNDAAKEHHNSAHVSKANGIAGPVVHKSKDVVDTPELTITEYFGNVASDDASISACLATVTAPCQEAFQCPAFDEYVLVISGTLILQHGASDTTVVRQGEGVFLKSGERVKWTWPGPCQYVPICLPAFSPANCGREDSADAVKTPATMKRLHEHHEAAAKRDVDEPAPKFLRSTLRQRNLASLPKAELHIHLEGAMRPETLTDLCRKHGIDRPMDTRWQQFDSFAKFAEVYIAACACLQEEADLFRLVQEVAEDAKLAGAIWVEAALSCHFYSERFGGTEGVLKVLSRAAEAAEAATGVAMAFIMSVERMLSVEIAEEFANSVRAISDSGAKINGRPAIVGLGLHAAEEGNPPEPFAHAIEIACNGSGLVPLPHAGEFPPSPGQGPASVRFCVDKLGAPRIGHGVLAAEDDELVTHLADKGVCLDVCPTSNYLLRVVGSLAEHPLPRLLAAGVACSINTDDPLLFGCDLLSEFEVCRKELRLSDAELAACARSSFVHSRAPEEIKRRGLDGVTAWLASSGEGSPSNSS